MDEMPTKDTCSKPDTYEEIPFSDFVGFDDILDGVNGFLHLIDGVV